MSIVIVIAIILGIVVPILQGVSKVLEGVRG